MRAIVLSAFGPAANLVAGTLPDPVAGPGQLLVQVAATSVNPIDIKIRSGAVPAISPALPAVLHGDVVGRVVAIGAGVSGWATGDAVWACGGGVRGCGGALAELMAVDAALATRPPTSLTPTDAAALPLVGITAWQAVIERGAVGVGSRVLVHGGSGGVGHVAVQLARLAGGQVTTTVSSPAKAAAVRDLGADAVLIGRETPAADAFDIVIDTIGGANLAHSFRQVAAGGNVVSIASRTQVDLTPLHGKAATVHAVFMALPLLTGHGRAALGGILRQLAALVDAGRVRPLIGGRFTLPEAAAAHTAVESGGILGKVVVAGW